MKVDPPTLVEGAGAESPAHSPGAAPPSPGAHLHPKFRDILERPVRERLEFMNQPRWIEYRTARVALDTLKQLLKRASGPKMRNLLVIGDTNNGKTTLANHFHHSEGSGYVDEKAEPVKPVVIAKSPPSANEKALYIAILDQFWSPYRPTGPVVQMRYQAIHKLRACRTRMLVIDDIHTLLTGTAGKQRVVMNALKMLCNELLIPIVGLGTKDAVEILHADDEHRSRFDVATLPGWKQDEEFQRLLAGFEQVLPLKRPSNLAHPDIAIPLHAVSGGNIGNLHRLLVECARDAITSGAEQIDLRTVEKFQTLTD